MNMERAGRVLDNLEDMGMSQVLVTDPMSIWYLTGYWNLPYERFYALYLARTDGGIKTVMFCNRLFPDATATGCEIKVFDDTEDPIPLVVETCDGSSPLGVDKVLAARWLLPPHGRPRRERVPPGLARRRPRALHQGCQRA